MLLFYFYLISFSILGYGLLTASVLRINLYNFACLGFLGIFFITTLSYFSSIFIPHSYIFNSMVIILGIFIFIILFKKIPNIKKEFINYFIIFSPLALFILVSKNHDDFPYYHFPYIALLTEHSHPIGLGQLNNGFRNPSSIFFLSSIFYLPKINFYLFHIAPAFFLGFANLFLLKNIFDKNIFKKIKFINLISLFFFVFINIFFYRLSEHGTDRSGLILAICSIILLFYIINNDLISENIENNIKFLSILLCLLISLKPFYLIYSLFFVVLFFNENAKKIVLKLFFSNTFIFCFFFIFLCFFYNFINSGCVIFPAKSTCFFNLKWSIPATEIENVRIWYELWSKGGATPNNVVDNKIDYISGFNWFKNWVNIYFFNKVSDFLLGLSTIIVVFFITFYSSKTPPNSKKNNFKYLTVYILIILCLVEWFMFHPALRYGGYHLFALVTFVPLSIYFSNHNFTNKFFNQKALILIIITIMIFCGRNISRLNKEYNLYSYNPLYDTKFQFNEELFLRYSKQINREIDKYERIKFLGKSFIITKLER